MMSMFSSVFSALKSWLPEWAMVPRFCSNSSRVMPMPLSETVSIRFSLSRVSRMRKSSRFIPTEVSVRLLK